MQILFPEIFVPKDFTIRLLLGSVDTQTHVGWYFHVFPELSFSSANTLLLKAFF